ncbi:MAG: GGDEF domain-containing protein [Porphyrobacter sp.]|nr:GGDEF domain-containing protein [Porphyrobacter sp.]
MPLEVALLLCAGCIAAGVWFGQFRTRRSQSKHRPQDSNPFARLHATAGYAEAIDLAARRNAARAGSQAMLHGRIDQFAAFSQSWNSQTREEVRGHVAAIMRAGLRRDDRITLATDGFTILVPGADERAAVRIADRLRRKLAELVLPQLGHDARLTATFGVAARPYGDAEDGLVQRARQAFAAAAARGGDHIVPASEIEEIMLLPAPAPSPSASAA